MKSLQILNSELPSSISLQAPTGRILSVPPVGERTAPHPALSPSDGERGKGRWQQGRARPLTPALSPSDGERETRDRAAAGPTDKMRPKWCFSPAWLRQSETSPVLRCATG